MEPNKQQQIDREKKKKLDKKKIDALREAKQKQVDDKQTVKK